ncbi:MAG: hypothetical protein CO150_01730 [Nitrospirae bacterium CG_4_9_14_3_um_filter_53_35]|nr:MAG: hypothetical protein AUK29_00330 [Nitrospirae bacterium CG2_30_53_67]PIS37403.1 MAG: hypothetical protein COT35_06225 [Nitrospirae bacterium CG08_land_8_20_14_0_20_52_24]PIV82338.1 MAG: hypothetical protein COW52_14155 [Nitrospirae bacterium CG17_big_fil_post_rev_8_21_14_2_50_50_9]PIW85409.1 MAG: hypothetical protein COZ95_04705 [Nitrospirae bacterium CG_4_8_14_3_um_filter_50_41]PIX86068.1 MAG: hypothetical protein COZ32_05215 [Nitrospirae bacterium CG_4_10_14_3_um_filter_53_41]PJA7728
MFVYADGNLEKGLDVNLQELLDIQVLGVTIRSAARAAVFGGIAVILVRKLIRIIKGGRSR